MADILHDRADDQTSTRGIGWWLVALAACAFIAGICAAGLIWLAIA